MTRAPEQAARELRLSRRFAAPRDLVFRLWTDPRYVALWWGIEGSTNARCEIDARPGGAWRIEMRMPDGTVFPNGGEYREVVANERLVYTDVPDAASPAWRHAPPPGTIVSTVTFHDDGVGTRVELCVRFASAADHDRLVGYGMAKGIEQGLARLERLAATVHNTERAP